MNERGFTLLEMLVATVIMGIAVVALLGNISTSMRHAGDLTEYDRAALLARRSGWTARLELFEAPPQAPPGTSILERLELEVWWMRGQARRTVNLEAFRRAVLEAPQGTGSGAL
jgi:general secretion pathway protein I